MQRKQRALHETCQQYVARRLSEGWGIVWQSGYHLVLSSPDGNILRPVDLRNDIETLRPNAGGDETNCLWCDPIAHDPDPAENYKMVDEADPPDELATYVTGGKGATNRDLYNLSDHSVGSGIINHITVYARLLYDGVASADGIITIKSGTGAGAPDTIGEGPTEALTESWVNYNNAWNTNPATTAAWTWDEIDKLQAGINLIGGYETDGKCTQLYVEVDYTPPVVGLENKSANMGSKMVAAGLI